MALMPRRRASFAPSVLALPQCWQGCSRSVHRPPCGCWLSVYVSVYVSVYISYLCRVSCLSRVFVSGLVPVSPVSLSSELDRVKKALSQINVGAKRLPGVCLCVPHSTPLRLHAKKHSVRHGHPPHPPTPLHPACHAATAPHRGRR